MERAFLEDIVPTDRVRFDEPMRSHTSFRVGGPADAVVTPRTETEALDIIRAVRRAGVPFIVIGKGTNLLVSDRGIRGVVVILSGGRIDPLDDGLLRAEAGVSLRQLCEHALTMGLTGLEFAAGIPGSVGGAVTMNAGAYGGEMSHVVRSVRLMHRDGNVRTVPGSEMQFGYRTSIVQESGAVVLSADFALRPGDRLEGRRTRDELLARRRRMQPLELPSAGSTFRRPRGAYAGMLIQSCGLRGARIGGAMVSPKHAGFIVNADNASASDIYRLIREVRDVVYRETGFTLEPEVKILGEFE